MHHCVSFGNTRGLGTGSSPDPIKFHNCTGFDNQHYDFHASDAADKPHEFRNCLSYGNRTSFQSGAADSSYNSWDLDISDPQFLSTNPDDDMFLHLSDDSPAINSGKDFGYEFGGSSPDLGGYDYMLDTQQLL